MEKVDDAVRIIKSWRAKYENGAVDSEIEARFCPSYQVQYAVYAKNAGKVIGTLGLADVEGVEIEVGLVLSSDFAGKRVCNRGACGGDSAFEREMQADCCGYEC